MDCFIDPVELQLPMGCFTVAGQAAQVNVKEPQFFNSFQPAEIVVRYPNEKFFTPDICSTGILDEGDYILFRLIEVHRGKSFYEQMFHIFPG